MHLVKKRYIRGLSGEKDPFFDSFNSLYPQKGFEGFVEENPQLFKNMSSKDIALSSKRYKEVTKNFSPKLLKVFTIPTLIATYLLLPNFAQFGHPVIFSAGIFTAIMSMISIPVDMYKGSFNQRVFDARKRISSDLGIISKDIKNDTSREQVDEDS